MSRRYRVTPEDIRLARDAPLLPELERRGYALMKDGRYYRLAEHDSLVIDPQRNRWHWNSQGIKNANTLDWLMLNEQYSLPDAVRELLGNREERTVVMQPKRAALPVKTPWQLPEKHTDHHRAFAYLTITRKIDTKLVQELLHKRLIYEDSPHHNAVFVRYDETGSPAGFFARSTISGSSYMYEPKNSDKRWTFLLPGEDTRGLYVAESAIDACSIETLRRRQGLQANLYPILSLGGNSIVAFQWYLQRYAVDTVICCTDNDRGGEIGYQAIEALYSGRLIRACPPIKDWNAVCQDTKTTEWQLPFAQMEKELFYYEKI